MALLTELPYTQGNYYSQWLWGGWLISVLLSQSIPALYSRCSVSKASGNCW